MFAYLAALLGDSHERTAFAHPVPAARVKLSLQDTGSFELRIKCDISALVMQAMPGHLGEAANELRALSESEIEERVQDAKLAIEHYLQLSFNGTRIDKANILFPALDVIRSGAAHGGEEDWPEILLNGNWPPTAKTCEITFPATIGRVQLELVRQQRTLLKRELAAGTRSGPLSLQVHRNLPTGMSVADWIGWLLAALLLAYLFKLYLGRPQNYSRNTNTGQ